MEKIYRGFCFVLLSFITLMCNNLYAQEFEGVYWDKDNNPHPETILSFGYSNWGTDEEPEIVWGAFLYSPHDDEVIETIFFTDNTQYRYEELFSAGPQKMKDVFTLYKPGENKIYQFFNLDGDGGRISTINFVINTKDGAELQFACPRSPSLMEEFYLAIDNAILMIPFSQKK